MPLVAACQTVSAAGACYVALELLTRRLLLPRLIPSENNSGTGTKLVGCIASLAHCVFTLVMATAMAANIQTHPDDPSGEALYIPNHLVVLSGAGSVGYLLEDLGHMITNRRVYSGMLREQVLHHVVSITMVAINFDCTWYNYALPVLNLGELSTVFLNLRVNTRMYCVHWCVRACVHGGLRAQADGWMRTDRWLDARTNGHGRISHMCPCMHGCASSAACICAILGSPSYFFPKAMSRLLGKKEIWASVLFALTFFLSRVLALGWLVLHLLSNFEAVQARLDPLLQFSYLGLLPALYCLNLYWFVAICRSVAKVLKGKQRQQ